MGGVLIAGVGSCPGVRSHVWRGYWSGLACLASGLVLTTERTRRGWQPLKQREKDIILPAHSLGARMSNFMNTLTASECGFLTLQNDYHTSYIMTNYLLWPDKILFPPECCLSAVPVVRIARVFATRARAWLGGLATAVLQCAVSARWLQSWGNNERGS